MMSYRQVKQEARNRGWRERALNGCSILFFKGNGENTEWLVALYGPKVNTFTAKSFGTDEVEASCSMSEGI